MYCKVGFSTKLLCPGSYEFCHLSEPVGSYTGHRVNKSIFLERWECTISEPVTLITRERSAVGGKASEVRAIPPGHYCTVKSQSDKDPQE